MKKPFPEIHANILEERLWPKDCYVFEGQGEAPSNVYMPLFNQQNCKGLFCGVDMLNQTHLCSPAKVHYFVSLFTDAEEFKAKMEEFTTFQRPFNQDKINFLIETAKSNIQRNRGVLLREMKKAVSSR